MASYRILDAEAIGCPIMGNIDLILSKLEKVRRRTPNEWMSCCPVHQEKTPSLSIKNDDGKILIYCFGCGADAIDVVGAIGVDQSELFSDNSYEDTKPYIKRDIEKEKTQQESKIKAQKIWDESDQVIDHSYLELKQIKPHGIRLNGDNLVVPLYNSKNEICSLQFIDPDGNKKFLYGGQVKDCYYRIGASTDRIYITEGFATAAAINEATLGGVIVAFNSGKLVDCAISIRKEMPNIAIIICADIDANGEGMKKATIAADAVDGIITFPTDLPEGKTDFNDMAIAHGIDSVTTLLSKISLEKDIIQDTKFISKYDLKSPPGLVGEVTKYINSQCRFPMENLSVQAAIVAVGNIGGLNHKLDGQKICSNLFAFAIAGSSAGKEAVLQAFNDIHIEAGMSAAVHGTIKSEQSIVRDLIRNQSAFYNIDEMGLFLQKLNMSQKSGGSSYLQGVIGMLMSAYSKSSGNLLLSGDLRDDLKDKLNKEMAVLNKKLDQGNATASTELRIKEIQDNLNSLDKGLKNPFLSLIGFSTPSTFNDSVSFDQVTNGFIGRSIIANEPNTNPRPKVNFQCPDIPESLSIQIRGLCANGEYSQFDNRVESNGEYTIITTTPEANKALQEASGWIFDEADKHVERTGFEAVVRRGYEMIEKVSFILAMGSTERTIEHVEWAFEYIRKDIEYKTHLAYSNVKEKSDPITSMMAKIICSLSPDGITVNRLVHKYRSKKDIVQSALERLINDDKVYTEERSHKFKKQKSIFIFAK